MIVNGRTSGTARSSPSAFHPDSAPVARQVRIVEESPPEGGKVLVVAEVGHGPVRPWMWPNGGVPAPRNLDEPRHGSDAVATHGITRSAAVQKPPSSNIFINFPLKIHLVFNPSN